jgi:hypothetical protein
MLTLLRIPRFMPSSGIFIKNEYENHGVFPRSNLQENHLLSKFCQRDSLFYFWPAQKTQKTATRQK